MRDLKEIRKDIDKIDNQLIELFKQRMDCARDVGIYKQANNIPVLNEGRGMKFLMPLKKREANTAHLQDFSTQTLWSFQGRSAQHCRQRQRA